MALGKAEEAKAGAGHSCGSFKANNKALYAIL
jgi:hypothetical protein